MQRKSEFWYCEKKNVIIYSRSSEQYPHHVIQKWPTAPKSGRRVCTIACSARQQAKPAASATGVCSPCPPPALLACCSLSAPAARVGLRRLARARLLPPFSPLESAVPSGTLRSCRPISIRLEGGRGASPGPTHTTSSVEALSDCWGASLVGWAGRGGGQSQGRLRSPGRGRAAPPTAGSGGCSARAARAASSNLQDESPGCARHYSTHPCHGRVPILLSRRKAHGHSV